MLLDSKPKTENFLSENQIINSLNEEFTGIPRNRKILFILPERIEFLKLVQSLSGSLSKNNISIVVILDNHETDVLKEIEINEVIFRDLSNYTSKTALAILNEEMPCLVITDNDQEPIRGAFVLTAKKLNIPTLVLREIVVLSQPKPGQVFILIFRKLNELPRIFKKYLFTFKSIAGIKPLYLFNIPKVVKDFFNNLSDPVAGKFADYILTNTVEDAELLKKCCLRARFICAVGDPRFENLLNLSDAERLDIRREIETMFNISPNKKIILFLSSSQVEHGMWSEDQKKVVNKEILALLSKFQEGADIIVKLHPVERNIFPLVWEPSYENFIHVTNFNISKLIVASDLVITWVSTAMINVVLARKPLIVIDFFNDGVIGGVLLSTQAIVDQGAALKAANGPELYHCTKQLLNDNHLLETLRSRQDVFHNTYLKTIDGKSIDRISETILDIIGC